MEHYAGLDVSLKEISICVVDHDGKTIARGACPADPEGVAGWRPILQAAVLKYFAHVHALCTCAKGVFISL
ncbi:MULTISPECIES: hypothetical protein [unclassified Sulfitobacter]|uniref:hypothetical protein n=1 Tax=unclassified Sulfitobacter TaxID=196795 RepID=UPI0023E0D6C7|nr:MULTISPECIES: hypothetical protein [unclassified Sulfitobacter]